MGLKKDRKTYAAIQAFMPREEYCNLTSGATLYRGDVTECVAAGSLVFTFPSGGTETIACLVGSNLTIPEGCTVTISSGTFHIS